MERLSFFGSILMSAEYDRLGIRFEYPENWSLDEEDAVSGSQAVSVHSPQGAFWTVAIHPPNTDRQALLDAALGAMREEYDELDVEMVEQALGPYQAMGYDFNFYCLDLTSTACVRCVTTPAAMLIIFHQAEDRDLPDIAPVFEAMTASLLRP